MSKTSPESTNPPMPARKSMTSTWNRASTVTKYRQLESRAAAPSSPTSTTRAAASPSATSGIPPPAGDQPPSGTTTGWSRVATSSRPPAAATASAPRTAAASTTARGTMRPTASRTQPSRTGPAITSVAAASGLTGRSPAQLAELVGVDRAVALGHLHGEGEQECGDGGRDDDVRERHGLHHGVDDRRRACPDRADDRRRRPSLVAHREQQDVGAGLADRQAHDGVHQVATPHDAQDPDQQQPHRAPVRGAGDGRGHRSSTTTSS